MRKIIIVLMALILTLGLITGCGGNSGSDSRDPKCADVLNYVKDKTEDGFDTVYSAGDDTYEDNYDNMYAVKRDLIDDGGILYTEAGGLADEITLMHIKDQGDIQLVKDKLNDRLEQRKNQFGGYKPEEVYKIENAVIMVSGNFVGLIISSDPPMMESIVREAISSSTEGSEN